MALFGKKKPAEFCAICGKERKTGLLRGLFQIEVEGQYVCNDCYGDVDVQQEILSNMTMDQFKAYIAFREENAKRKEKFSTTSTVDFGVWDTKILFDSIHGFMCMDKNLDKTIFQRGDLRSFVIREDDRIIFSGNAAGLMCNQSDVSNQIRRMELKFATFRREQRIYENKLLNMSAEERARQSEPRFNEEEPFQNFYVELYFDHPYWNQIKADMNGPRFNKTDPSADQYMTSYRLAYETMEQLARELMAFAFPAAAGTQTDAANALLRFKELLDVGAITQEEFDAKKRQLLGV